MSRRFLAKNTPILFFASGETDPPPKSAAHFFSAEKSAAHKTRGVASRTTPAARGENPKDSSLW